MRYWFYYPQLLSCQLPQWLSLKDLYQLGTSFPRANMWRPFWHLNIFSWSIGSGEKTLIFAHVKNHVPRQQQVPCRPKDILSRPRSPTSMNKLRIHECTCTPWKGCVCKYVNWCQKHLYSVHTSTCTGAEDTCLVHATLTAKNAHTPTKARLCDCAATSLQWRPNHLET